MGRYIGKCRARFWLVGQLSICVMSRYFPAVDHLTGLENRSYGP